jgi:hypothetical protein
MQSLQSGAWNREGSFCSRGNRPLRENRPGASPLPDECRRRRGNWPQPRNRRGANSSRLSVSDGRHFLYTAIGSVAENSAVYAASLDSKETKRLLTSDANVAYTEDASGQGYLLFLRSETLLAQRFDAARLDLQGEPFPVAENVAIVRANFLSTSEGRTAQFSVSANGVLSYQRAGAAAKELVWSTRGQRPGTVGGRLIIPTSPFRRTKTARHLTHGPAT